MVKLSNLLKKISLAALLRELRLLDGQPGYRFCMSWFLVLTHIAVKRRCCVGSDSTSARNLGEGT